MMKLKDILNEVNDDILNKSSEELINRFGSKEFNSKQDAVRYIDNILTSSFPKGIKNIPSEITLYRVIAIREGDDIDAEDIGIHFVADKSITTDKDWLDRIGIFSGVDDDEQYDYQLWLLTCKVSRKNVDLEQTIQNRLLFPGEEEFTLKSPVGIRIVDKEQLDITDYL